MREKLSESDVAYPRDVFMDLILNDSPYAFYLFQWVPYQPEDEAHHWRLKMEHDVKHFDGRIEYNVWPNGRSCGSFSDDEVEFIRISRKQFRHEWTDPRKDRDISLISVPDSNGGKRE